MQVDYEIPVLVSGRRTKLDSHRQHAFRIGGRFEIDVLPEGSLTPAARATEHLSDQLDVSVDASNGDAYVPVAALDETSFLMNSRLPQFEQLRTAIHRRIRGPKTRVMKDFRPTEFAMEFQDDTNCDRSAAFGSLRPFDPSRLHSFTPTDIDVARNDIERQLARLAICGDVIVQRATMPFLAVLCSTSWIQVKIVRERTLNQFMRAEADAIAVFGLAQVDECRALAVAAAAERGSNFNVKGIEIEYADPDFTSLDQPTMTSRLMATRMLASFERSLSRFSDWSGLYGTAQSDIDLAKDLHRALTGGSGGNVALDSAIEACMDRDRSKPPMFSPADNETNRRVLRQWENRTLDFSFLP
jgi:hypothetical protein